MGVKHILHPLWWGRWVEQGRQSQMAGVGESTVAKAKGPNKGNKEAKGAQKNERGANKGTIKAKGAPVTKGQLKGALAVRETGGADLTCRYISLCLDDGNPDNNTQVAHLDRAMDLGDVQKASSILKLVN